MYLILYISGPLAPPVVSSTIFTEVKGSCLWTKRPRSPPQKIVIHGPWAPSSGASRFVSFSVYLYQSKITKCYHAQSPQAGRARQHDVLLERIRKRLRILNFNPHLDFKSENAADKTTLLSVVQRQGLGHGALPRQSEDTSRSSCAGWSERCVIHLSLLFEPQAGSLAGERTGRTSPRERLCSSVPAQELDPVRG